MFESWGRLLVALSNVSSLVEVAYPFKDLQYKKSVTVETVLRTANISSVAVDRNFNLYYGTGDARFFFFPLYTK